MTAGDGVASDARLQVRGDSHLKSKIQVLATHNDDNPGTVVIAKSRGSGNVILGDNDDIGQLDFAGNDGNGYHIVGRIAVSSSGQGNGNDDLPTVMRFFTVGDGGVSCDERMRIDSSGRLLIGTTNYLDTAGTGHKLHPSTIIPYMTTTANTTSNTHSTYHLYNTNATNNGYRSVSYTHLTLPTICRV